MKDEKIDKKSLPMTIVLPRIILSLIMFVFIVVAASQSAGGFGRLLDPSTIFNWGESFLNACLCMTLFILLVCIGIFSFRFIRKRQKEKS